jgi:K+-sensing histidine kinase KdpD
VSPRRHTLTGYLASVTVVAVCALVSVAGAAFLQTAALTMVFPLAVLIVTARFGVGPAVLTAVGGVLVFDFVFVPPALAFAVPGLKDGVTLAVMVVVGAVASVMAEQLRRQVQMARHQADLEALRNALLSAISHDLRTPLSALVGASAALCEGRLDPEEHVQFSRMVNDEAHRLSRLVGNLLELTRLSSGRIDRQHKAEAIDEVIGSALRRLERLIDGRRVLTHVPESIPLAAFDPVLVEQVLINLVENVVRHTGAGSPVEIAARVRDGDIVVEVADRGPGVAPGDEERVFEKLYRGDKDRRGDGGAGLGLTICRAIVTAHDGRIWLENRPGGGSVVRFTLPLSRTPLADPDVRGIRSAADVRRHAHP